MRERGVILQPWEVRAFLDGRKQRLTRPVLHRHAYKTFNAGPDGGQVYKGPARFAPDEEAEAIAWLTQNSPLGRPGDRLYAKETWATYANHDARTPGTAFYAATEPQVATPGNPRWGGRWRSPVTMPRWASRILLEVTEVRVQRVRDITETEAMQEGVDRTNGHPIRGAMLLGAGPCFREGVAQALEDVSPGAWDRNDWVFAAAVKRLEVGNA